jgi:hypothetical protein
VLPCVRAPRGVLPGVLPVVLIFETSVWLPSVSLPKLKLAVDSLPANPYLLRRSTIMRSLGRFFLVFAPNVGKPQGVCG